MTTETLPVSEQFLSIQGEGATMGYPSYFLRLKSCNLLCGGKGTDKDGELHDGANWRCDTIEVWLKGQKKTFSQIADDFGKDFYSNLQTKGYHLIITGGEPMLHADKIVSFISHIASVIGEGFYVEIETNGTIEPEHSLIMAVNRFNVSPKLSNSGMPYKKRINRGALNLFSLLNITIFKFVIKNQEDFTECWKLIEEYDLDPNKIWLMPAADNDKDLRKVSEFVAQKCIKHGYKFSSRLHVAVWNKKTGV